jgi:hypothetical protein
MNPDIQELLKRQSSWQKSRKNLSWPEKLRQSLLLRESGAALRSMKRKRAPK